MRNDTSLRYAAVGSLIALSILLLGAVVFYKERMVFSDAAHIVFYEINQGKLQIQVERYGAFITQIWPLLGSKLNLSLKAILILYSLSFNVFYLAVALILFRFRDYQLVILMALYFTLFVSDSYFWTNNEVHQGITWMFLMLGTIQYLYTRFRTHGPLFHLVALVTFIPLALLSIYSHPLVMISTIFLWVFLALSGNERFFSRKSSIPYAVIIMAISGLKYFTSKQNWYDGNKFEPVLDAGVPEILGTFTSAMADNFWQGIIYNYFFLPLLFVAGIYLLVKKREYILATFTVAACVGYFVLVCLTFHEDRRFYMESEWMTLAILGTAPFVYYVLPQMHWRYAITLLSFILIVRIGFIGYSSTIFTSRTEKINGIVERMKQRAITKAIIKREDDRLENELLMGWGLPLETLYMSILNNEDTLRTMAYFSQEEVDRVDSGSSSSVFLAPFASFSYEELNRNYFPLDTTTSYSILVYDDFFLERTH